MHLLPFNLVEVTAQKLWVSGHCSPCALCLLCSVSCLISVRNPFPQPPSHHWTWGLLLVPATILTHTLNLKYFNIAAAAAKSLHSCLTMRPHRWQPTRLPRPWDSPGKNTGVGCHFLLQCMKGKSESEVIQSCPTLSYPMDCSLPSSSIHGILQARVLEWGAIVFSDFNTGMF